MKILQITPEARPLAGGVRATAEAVARALREDHGIESVFVTGAELLESGRFPERPALPDVLLHYVGYGYAPRGCPWWLVRGLERWRKTGAVRRLVTVFHEINASGPPWTSAFWLNPVQRHLARRVARSSDALWTSLELYGAILSRWAGDRPVLTVPVPSAVGEPETALPLCDRTPQLVVFGTPGVRERAYRHHRDALSAACRYLGLERILDVGAPAQAVPESVGAFPVELRGPLPDAEVSRILGGSRAAFLAYPAALLEKSSVFAAYAAHGVVPVCAWKEPGPGSLEPHVHFLPADALPGDPQATAETVSHHARAWYMEHRVSRQAELLAGCFTE